jgi:hypothetical protein
MTPELWTFTDMNAGRCRFGDVGKPRPASATPETLQPGDTLDTEPDEIVLPDLRDASNQRIAEESARVLRLAAMKVFERLGHENWLFDLARNSPKEFLKLLQRLLPQSIEQTVTIQNQIPENIRNLRFEDLLAMRAALTPADVIDVDVEIVEPRKQAAR